MASWLASWSNQSPPPQTPRNYNIAPGRLPPVFKKTLYNPPKFMTIGSTPAPAPLSPSGSDPYENMYNMPIKTTNLTEQELPIVKMRLFTALNRRLEKNKTLISKISESFNLHTEENNSGDSNDRDYINLMEQLNRELTVGSAEFGGGRRRKPQNSRRRGGFFPFDYPYGVLSGFTPTRVSSPAQSPALSSSQPPLFDPYSNSLAATRFSTNTAKAPKLPELPQEIDFGGRHRRTRHKGRGTHRRRR